MSSIDVAGAVRNILGDSNLNSELSTALVSLASALDQLKKQQIQMKDQQDASTKELELVRRMSRTNWLLVINLPLPFGLSKGQALQRLFDNLNYSKPLFDSERDLLAAEILYVNKNGATCNMSFFVAQRHYDHIMGAEFQRKLVTSNQNVPRGMRN
ncbi:unnamed protein product [Cylicocyclus nassatus]|uniref:Uncharacterized protein n=1 Tax=Cylicocyclus nassatus TaxID=53992 RepID=A0AA36GLX2_CYLNA|nr:unnamed protein product [Cylicocyclus nassatus]